MDPVLVAGGAGFIGTHLVDLLAQKAYPVTVFDRAPVYQADFPAGIRYRQGDIGDRAALQKALRDTDVVFHLVSTTIPRTSNQDPVFDVQSNLADTVRLLVAAVQSGVRKVVYISSGGAVYGLPRQLPIPEDHPQQPVSSYGIVKLAIERYLHLFYHLYQLEYAIIRPSNPYGPQQNPLGNVGVIAVFLGQIARQLPVSIWGSGEVMRDFLHVRDLAQALVKAGQHNAPHLICNIGAGRGVTLNQLVQHLAQVTGRDIPVRYENADDADPPAILLDITRARRLLDWSPSIPLENGLQETWEWVQAFMASTE
jgi:UDP-glucose 4-epimerase